MLDYITSHNLPLTAEALFEAFNALRPNLAPGERMLSYGSTTVVDLGTRNENPS